MFISKRKNKEKMLLNQIKISKALFKIMTKQCSFISSSSSPSIIMNNNSNNNHILKIDNTRIIPVRLLSNHLRYQMAPYPKALEQQPIDLFKLSPRQSWKEAASLIILAPDDLSNQNFSMKFDYKTLMVKRSARSSFFASAYVFPGGQVELIDFKYKWYELFEKLGVKKYELDRLSEEIVGPRPPMITDPITFKVQSFDEMKLNMDIALRISAIRETFEEAGILILVDPKRRDNDYCNVLTSQSLNIDLNEWQKKVSKNAESFYDLCDELKMVPNVWSLYEWSNWLTPTSVGHRRFDTIFYVCCFHEKPPVYVDDKEVTTPIWCNPIEILEQHRQEKAFLAPPQVYELSRFMLFPMMDRLYRFMKSRQTLGCQRWLPVIVTYNDGSFSLVPGDEQYPIEPKLISEGKQITEIDEDIDDAILKVKAKNRMELKGITCRAICTIEPGCGHLAPLTYPSNDELNDPSPNPMAKL